MSRDYKKDIKIDPEDLEGEWIEQGSLFLYYAEAHADALHARDMSKSKLDLTYAKLYSDIKKNWEKHFDAKPTEPAIKEFILNTPTYQRVERKLIDDSREANIMLAAKTAFDHRKRALENLVSMRISGFHSEPRRKTRTIKTGGYKAQKESLNNEGNTVKTRVRKRKRRS